MIVACICLALAGALTLGIPPLGQSIRGMHGPDASMSEILFIFAAAPRWIFLSAALAIAIKRGGFDWISRQGLLAAAAIFAVQIAAGVVSFAAMMTYRREEPLSDAGLWIFSFLIPLVMIALCAIALRGAPTSPGLAIPLRAVGLLLAAVTAVGGALAYRQNAKAEAAQAAYVAEREREERELLDKRLAELNALTDASPLADWLPFLEDHRNEVNEPAVARVAARPTLVADLTAMLGGEQRIAALKYIWLRMPRPPKELAAPALATIPPLIERTRAYLAADGEPYDPDLTSACEAMVVLAYQFRESGLDFRAPIQSWLDVLNEKPIDATSLGRSYIEGWLAQQPGSPPPAVVMPPG